MAVITESNLTARVADLTALTREPGSEVYVPAAELDLEAWQHVGDPLCEDLLQLMRGRKLMGRDIYANARALEADGVPEAVEFFRDVEAVPDWCDFEAMRAGSTMARRNPMGVAFGMHGGLPFTYSDRATAHVMASTGRFDEGGDYRRRYWETGSGFIGAIDVDGMRPGGERWINWVRIRFMHTMIRLGILRSGRWELEAMPIGQLPTAAATHIFGPYRANIIRYFGGHVSQEEEDSFALMWRWVSRIEGANNQLLGRTSQEQYELQTVIHEHLYSPDEKSAQLTQSVITGSAAMKTFMLPRRVHNSIVRNLLLPERTLLADPTVNLADGLQVPEDPKMQRALDLASKALYVVNSVQRLPIANRLADKYGQQLLDHMIDRGLQGTKANFRGAPVAGQRTDA